MTHQTQTNDRVDVDKAIAAKVNAICDKLGQPSIDVFTDFLNSVVENEDVKQALEESPEKAETVVTAMLAAFMFTNAYYAQNQRPNRESASELVLLPAKMLNVLMAMPSVKPGFMVRALQKYLRTFKERANPIIFDKPTKGPEND